MLEVFKHPERYLGGPHGILKQEQRHFAIVGAGISGLTMALLLLKLGHQVTTRLQLCPDLKSD